MAPYTPGPWELTPFEWIRARDADPQDLALDESQLIPVLILGRGVHQEGNALLIAAAPALAFAWNMVDVEIRERIFDLLRTPDLEWVEQAITAILGPLRPRDEETKTP